MLSPAPALQNPLKTGPKDHPTLAMAEIAREILPVNLEEEMRKSYLDYAMSVIVGRALPDVRDG